MLPERPKQMLFYAAEVGFTRWCQILISPVVVALRCEVLTVKADYSVMQFPKSSAIKKHT